MRKLITKHGLKLTMQKYDDRLDLTMSYNPILIALELGDNILLEKATKFMPNKWTWEQVKREDGATPVQLAISDQRVDLLKTLLNAKAPVNQLGWCDLSPLKFALPLQCRPEIIDLLKENGATLDGKQ